MKGISQQEIERKFLVKELPSELSGSGGLLIEQGYLAVTGDAREVRVRRKNDSHYLTVKTGSGRSRHEVELAISDDQFQQLWPLTEGRRLRKRRQEIPWHDWVIELDIYEGSHRGLIIAEVEFPADSDPSRFNPPAWFGREVTGEERYKNQNLALHS